MDKICQYIREKGENAGLRCETQVKGFHRRYCGVHHKLLVDWLMKQAIKDKVPYDDSGLYK